MKKLYDYFYEEGEIEYEEFEKQFIRLNTIVIVSLITTLLIRL